MMDTPNRHIHLGGTFNTRDYGGYQTTDGGRVKWRRLYRSDDLHTLTRNDITWFQTHQLTTIIDYRNPRERALRPNRTIPNTRTLVLAPEDATAAMASTDLRSDQRKIATLQAAFAAGTLDPNADGLLDGMIAFVRDPATQRLYREVILAHLARPDAVVLQHCRGGKDRTGYGVALILLALGVPEETVIADYLLTARYNQVRNAQRMAEYEAFTSDPTVLAYLARAMSTRREVIEAGLAAMKEIADTPLDYLTTVLKITPAQLAQLRAQYVDPA